MLLLFCLGSLFSSQRQKLLKFWLLPATQKHANLVCRYRIWVRVESIDFKNVFFPQQNAKILSLLYVLFVCSIVRASLALRWLKTNTKEKNGNFQRIWLTISVFFSLMNTYQRFLTQNISHSNVVDKIFHYVFPLLLFYYHQTYACKCKCLANDFLFYIFNEAKTQWN